MALIALRRSREWWRPAPAATPAAADAGTAAPAQTNPWAFRALLFFVVINLGSPQSYLPILGPLRLALLSALAAMAFYLFSSDKALKSRPMPTELKLILAFVGWAVVSVPFAFWPGGSAASILDFSKTLMFFWLLSRVIVKTDQLRAIFWTMSLLALPLAFTGVQAYLAGELREGRIVGHGGLASNANDLAMTLNLIIPMAAVMGITAKRWTHRLAAIGVIGISLGCIVLTFSRGGFLGLATMIISALFLCVRRGNAKPIAIGVIVLVVGLACLPSSYYDRLSTIGNPDADETGSAQGRLVGMNAAVEYISEHPIFGAGLGLDAVVLSKMGAKWYHVHTAYLMCGVDLGLPGMALYIALLFCAYWKSRAVERDAYREERYELSLMATAIKVSLLTFGVMAVFAPVAYNVYFFYLAGLSVAVQYCFRPVTASVATN